MIDVLIVNRSKAELSSICDAALRLAARLSEEEWNWFSFSSGKELAEFFKVNHIVDFACLDIAGDGTLKIAEKVRSTSREAVIMLVADAEISPMSYLKPSIMPGALLLRPFTKEQLAETLREAMKFVMKNSDNSSESVFLLNMKTERKMVPYSSICYFEARDKRIYLNAGNQEFAFYDTIDHLEEILPASFVRCHRSFIVSKAKIDKIFISKNYLELDNGMTVPLSRSYKSVLKELK